LFAKFISLNHLLKLFCLPILFLTGFLTLNGQEIALKGKIMDTLNRPLEYANVLALPESEGEAVVFSITDENGSYKLLLRPDTPYNIEISYLGYKNISVLVTLLEETVRDFILKPQNENLDEVVITKRLPVLVKKDTITYRPDAFITGNERKLREVLKKLPGVEVDRAGNVTVNGKKVDQLLIEGKTFFTGDTKLGVNNIPADAIDEIVALDNYSEIPFLKGLSESDKLALNIKLKAGKKKFVFGDIQAGVGIKERYLIQPTLFYYSPKTNVNLLGDVNNIGETSFTFNDYINFEGGFNKLVENPANYTKLFTSDFANSLRNEDFVFNRNTFSGFNMSHQLSSATSLSAYSIITSSKIDNEQQDINTYYIDNTVSDIEDRRINTNTKNTFSLSKLSLEYAPVIDKNITYSALVKTSQSNASKQLNSITRLDTNFVTTTTAPSTLEIIQNVDFSKQFSYKHTSTLQADLTVKKGDNNSNWLFSKAIFNETIPFQGSSPFQFNQAIQSQSHTGSLQLKHYWVLSNFHHIYPVIGHNFSNEKYTSTDSQSLNGEIVNFGADGFNNDTSFLLNDSFVGLQYKTQINNITVKPGIIYHYYTWSVDQFNEQQNSTQKGQLLPELLINWELRNTEKIKLKYLLRSGFNDASFYANRLRLLGFNRLYHGNDELENSLSHQGSLTYYKFNLQKGLFYTAALVYNQNVRSIRNSTVISGIDQINTSIYTNLPERTLSGTVSISKKFKRIKFTFDAVASNFSYSRNINEIISDFSSNNYSYNFKVETNFKNYPNLEIGISQRFNTFSSQTFQSNFTEIEPYAILQYNFLNDFSFKSDYSYTRYQNRDENILNTFQLSNASLYYNLEDSAWGFEFSAKNLFNVNLKNENSFNQFIVNDRQTFIQPRIFLFKLSYKL